MDMGGLGRRGGEQGTPRLLRLRKLGGRLYEAELVTEHGEKLRLQVRVDNDIIETPFGRYHLSSLDIPESEAQAINTGESWLVEFDEHRGVLRAKLSMKVVEATKKPGDKIRKGDKIATIETMKMLNDVHAPCDGEIVEITQPGQGLSPGSILARIKCKT